MANTASNASDARNDRTPNPPTRLEIYILIDYRPPAAPCGGKKRYSEADARDAADAHNQRFICGDMQAYPCAAHRAWHIGHATFRSGKNRQFREDYAWFARWAAKAVGNAA